MKYDNRFFSLFLILVMVFSLFSPIQAASANEIKPFKPTPQSESTMQLKAAIADQLNVLEGGPKLHKELQGLSGNQDVEVIIHLSEKPVALEKGIHSLSGKTFSSSQETQVRMKVQTQRNFVLKELALNNINIQQGYTFDTALNGFSATVKADDLDRLLTIQGITLVEPDTIVHASQEKPLKTKPTSSSNPLKDKQVDAMMNTSNSFLGIEKLWNEGLEGQGIKVAVLDTGIDADHPEFAGIYKGGKNFIPNSSTYTKNRADDDASETSPVERPANVPEFNERGSSFYTSHGTHVAGTIAAIGANEYGIKGIAPKVDLYAYRVLGAYGSGATSGIVKAIDTAVIEKMDVINLSLGGGANTETDSGSFAINNAMMAGTISVIATGNSGPNRGTMGTPSTARLGIAVGNTTNPEVLHNGQVNVAVGSYNLTKQLQLMGTTFGKDLATQLQGAFEIVAVPGNGEAKDYTGIDVNGKVALITRGGIAFVDKIAHAKEQGAVATIIHNFAGGSNAPNPSGTFLGDSFAFLPTYDMSQTDGEAIRAALKEGSGTITFGNFGSTQTAGDEVNDLSSRGPSTPNFDIKPDVSAPGTNIMSTIPMYKADFPDVNYDEAYNRKTGTSMATPHIAGIAALVKQANPSWNAFDVKVALSNTAKVLDKTKYDVFAQGAGRVDAYAAAHPSVLAYALDKAVLDGSGSIVDNLKGTVTFGTQSLSDNVAVTKQILVKDMKGNGGNYEVTVDVNKSFGDAEVTVDQPTFTLSGEQLLNVTLTASKATAPKGSEILGYIHINGGDASVSLPFAADFSEVPSAAIKDMAISETDLSFNDDGVKDSAVLSFTLTGDVTTNFIEVWDIMNPKGGEFSDGYIGYIHSGTALGKGSYTIKVAGKYKPWGSAPATKLPDGLYTLDFSGQAASGLISDYVGPIIVKTTKPEITGSVTEKVAKGQIVDKYLDYNKELHLYGMEFDLNEKLHASYIPTINGKEAAAVPFKLAEDGTFTFPVTDETEAVKVVVKDEAGNVGEALIYEKEVPEAVVTLSVNPTELKLTTGEMGQVTVTETTTPVSGDATNKDVTAEATYVVADEAVVTVDNGAVTAVGKGATTITITHGGNEVQVNVTVADPAVIVPGVTLTANKTEFDLQKGKEAQLTIKEVTTAADGTSKQKDVTKAAKYSSADKTVATVKNGLITAKNAGTTTVTVKYGKNELLVNVTVTEPGVTLTANKTQFDLELGKEAKMVIKEVTTAADGTPKQKDVTKAATYTVADNEIVSVTNGLIVSKNPGSTVITVKYGKNELTVGVTVTERGVTLTTNKTDIILETGKESQLTIKEVTTPPNGKPKETNVTKSATYEVADENVASVKAGLVTAKAAGNTTITVKYGKNELTVNVTVTQPVVTLTANKTQIDLEPQKEAQLVIKEVVTGANGKPQETNVTNLATYEVADNNVATVTKGGLVRAIKNAGSTTIKVTYRGNELTVDVNVFVPEVTLTSDQTHVELEAGKEAQLKITQITTTADGNPTKKNVTQNARYTVDNKKVATVSEGLITAKAAGETVITAKYGGNEVAINVIVTEPIVTISVDQTHLELVAGQEAQLNVKEVTTSVGGDATERDVTTAAKYGTDDNKVASVSNGLVRAKAAGSTTITVVYNGQKIPVSVVVTEPEVTIVANKTDLNLSLYHEFQLNITELTTAPDGTVLERDVTSAAKYNVENRKIVSVLNGLVRPKRTEGSTTITVTYQGKELIITVNVGNFMMSDGVLRTDDRIMTDEPFVMDEIITIDGPFIKDEIVTIDENFIFEDFVMTDEPFLTSYVPIRN